MFVLHMQIVQSPCKLCCLKQDLLVLVWYKHMYIGGIYVHGVMLVHAVTQMGSAQPARHALHTVG